MVYCSRQPAESLRREEPWVHVKVKGLVVSLASWLVALWLLVNCWVFSPFFRPIFTVAILSAPVTHCKVSASFL